MTVCRNLRPVPTLTSIISGRLTVETLQVNNYIFYKSKKKGTLDYELHKNCMIKQALSLVSTITFVTSSTFGWLVDIAVSNTLNNLIIMNLSPLSQLLLSQNEPFYKLLFKLT